MTSIQVNLHLISFQSIEHDGPINYNVRRGSFIHVGYHYFGSLRFLVEKALEECRQLLARALPAAWVRLQFLEPSNQLSRGWMNVGN